jgi:peptide/nickel transport system substrate-binding protein
VALDAEAARLAAHGRAMEVLLRDRPDIRLWHHTSLTGTGAAVQGLRLVPGGLVRPQGWRVRG